MASLVLGLSLTSVDAMNQVDAMNLPEPLAKKRRNQDVVDAYNQHFPDVRAELVDGKKIRINDEIVNNDAAIEQFNQLVARKLEQTQQEVENLRIQNEENELRLAREAFIANELRLAREAFIANEANEARIEKSRQAAIERLNQRRAEAGLAQVERFLQENDEELNARVDGFYQEEAATRIASAYRMHLAKREVRQLEARNAVFNAKIEALFDRTSAELDAAAVTDALKLAAETAKNALYAGLTRYLLPTVGLVVGTVVTQAGLGYMPSVEEAAMAQGTAVAIVLGGNSFYNAYNRANRVNAPVEESKDDMEVTEENSAIILDNGDNR